MQHSIFPYLLNHLCLLLLVNGLPIRGQPSQGHLISHLDFIFAHLSYLWCSSGKAMKVKMQLPFA